MTLKRTLAVLAFTLAAPLAFGQADETGAEPVRTPDRSTTCTLDSLNDTCSVALEGRQGIGVQITTSNLSATVVPELSFDGGTTWTAGYFIDSGTWFGAVQLSFTGGSATSTQSIVVLSGVTHVRSRVSVYTSGTASARIGATTGLAPQVVIQGDGQVPFTVSGERAFGTAVGEYPVLIGGSDGTNVQRIRTDTAGRLETTSGPITSANNNGACVSVTASTTVLASLATRKAFTLFARETNTDVVYIKMGATATSADFPLPAGSAYNMQAGVVYTGVIDAIAASGTQSVCVVEF